MRTERIYFRLIVTPCCGQALCWVNPRRPNYCPECGEAILTRLNEAIRFTDDKAELRLSKESPA